MAAHGTYARYIAGCRCRLCTKASAEYQRGYRQRQRQAQDPNRAWTMLECMAAGEQVISLLLSAVRSRRRDIDLALGDRDTVAAVEMLHWRLWRSSAAMRRSCRCSSRPEALLGALKRRD